MDTIVSISVIVLIVLIVGGFVFGLYGLTLGRVKHAEELRQADIEQAELLEENPEYDYYEVDQSDGFFKYEHSVSDATALFDAEKKLLHLKSEVLGDRTEACKNDVDAQMAFEDYLRGLYGPNPPSEMENSPKDD